MMNMGPIFATKQFSVHAARCLNRHSHVRHCHGCADGCPTSAITLTHDDVVLDESACLSCGICLAVCPMEVFVETAVAEDDLVKLVHETGKECVLLTCPLGAENSDVAVQNWIATDTIIETPRCLAAIMPSHLLQMTKMGQRTLWLHDLPCADCPCKEGHVPMKTAVLEANRWLENWGVKPCIYLETKESPDGDQETEWRGVDEQSQPSERRSFLRQLVGLETLSGADVVTANHIPRERKRLQTWWQNKKENREIKTEGIPITNITINAEVCSACGLCAKQCPTKALTFTSDEALTFQIRFKASDCIACGICAQVCPETAVSYNDTLPIEQLLTKQPNWLMGGVLYSCPDCQAQISQFGQHGFCHICRQKQARPHFLIT